jgi:putative ABC transport system ATP-binding protein
MSPKAILSVSNLNHYFGDESLRKQILHDINLEIKAQEIIILTGPSGSGKTTLLTLVGSLRRVQEGSLRFLNWRLERISNKQMVEIRRKIGYIFQGHNLLEFLTARQNVQMSLEFDKSIPHRDACSKAEAMLRAVQLGSYINAYPQQLSGGQKQRIAIARALVGHPKLILADEPTAALDRETGREVISLIQRLANEQGAAVLMVTHDNRILDFASRIMRMEDGHLIQD